MVGAGLTALLFTVGKFAIGFYLGKSDVGSAYGAAGSLVIVLVWVYYSAQILLFGAEFTQVYANQVGARIIPSKNAMVADPEKAKEHGSSDRWSGGRNVDAQPARKGWAAGEATVPSDRQSASGNRVPWWVGLLIIGVSALRSSRRSEK